MASGSVGAPSLMLSVNGKKTFPLDMYNPLRKYILSHYSERDAKDAEDDLKVVQKLRDEIENRALTLESRKENLQKYVRCLTLIESRFPISPERDHVNGIHFCWLDAFKPSKKTYQQNLHFEKAAVLFNLGAVQSQLGLAADRSSPEGLKTAANLFQSAAGIFSFLKEKVSLKAQGGAPPASLVDISPECSGMLVSLMLAQAQECVFQRAASGAFSHAACAKLARHASFLYQEAQALLDRPPLVGNLDRAWGCHVALKTLLYDAEAYYRTALDLHEKEDIGEEISRLKAALDVIGKAKVAGRNGGDRSILDSIAKLEEAVSRNLKVAERENDKVYLMRIPANSTLPPIPAMSLVQPLKPTELDPVESERMFQGLVPESSFKVLSKYTEMVDAVIREQAEALQNESDLARVKLREMELPDLLLSLQGDSVIPEHVLEDVQAVQVDGGPAGLEPEMDQLRDLRRVNEELLLQTEEILEKEAREDIQIRTQFGTKWTRPASSTLTKNLRDRATGFAGNLRQAAESDGRIERSIKDSEKLLMVLRVQPIEAAMPKLSKPIVSVHGDEDEIVTQLKQLLADLERLGLQRAGLEDLLKETKRKDDILPKLMNSTVDPDELFKHELAKYDSIVEQVKENITAQRRVLAQIEAQNEIFIKAFSINEHKAAREKMICQITDAVTKYREIRENMNEGLKFYITLQDAITNLKQQCGDYVMTRSIQCREMMEDLQRQVAGLAFSSEPTSAPRNYPSPSSHEHQQQQPSRGGFFSIFSSHNQQQQPPPPPPPAPPTAPSIYQPTPPMYGHQPNEGGPPPGGYYGGPYQQPHQQQGQNNQGPSGYQMPGGYSSAAPNYSANQPQGQGYSPTPPQPQGNQSQQGPYYSGPYGR